MFASARPPGSSVVAWGAVSTTFRPVGVFDSCCSGAIDIDGVKGSASQFLSVISELGWTAASGEAPRPHDWIVVLASSGSAHCVGSVRNGDGLCSAGGTHSSPNSAASPRAAHAYPREESCRGSPGVPQTVTRLEISATLCGELRMFTTTW